MAVEINNNPGGGNDGGGSAMTAIVAILVIVIIGLAVYFGFFRGRAAAPTDGTNINVSLPTGSNGAGGSAY